MDILVLGGTSFVGRAIVEDLLAHGHTPTLFSRGQTGADLFPGVERLVGDRESGDYSALSGRAWDAVVDVSGYVPRHVAEAGDAIEKAGRYLFISTGSVYDIAAGTARNVEKSSEGVTEDTDRVAPYRESENIDGQTYGALKVACEDDVQTRYGDQATIVRPGVVAGPHDPTDRFTYWVRRAAEGGRVAVPRPSQPVQVVDAGDLARLVTLLLEKDLSGIYNAVGPWPSVTLAEVVEECAAAAGTTVEIVPVDLEPGFPLTLPENLDVMFRRGAAAAHEVGMPKTPLVDTARAVLAWDRSRGLPAFAGAITPEREQELLG